jgi:hypothetical protein
MSRVQSSMLMGAWPKFEPCQATYVKVYWQAKCYLLTRLCMTRRLIKNEKSGQLFGTLTPTKRRKVEQAILPP